MRPAVQRPGLVLAAMVGFTIAWLGARTTLASVEIGAAMAVLVAAALASGVVAALLPRVWIERASDAIDRLARSDRAATAAVVVAAVAAAFATALSQQPLSCDEPHVLHAARIVADEGLGPFFARYRSIPWLGTNHPPLVVVAFGLLVRLGADLLTLRLVAVLGCAVTAAACLAIARRLVDRDVALLSALLLLSSPLFDRMGAAAMNDVFVTACFTVALALVLRLTRSGDSGAAADVRAGVLLGLVIGTGLLVKYTMVLVYPVLAAALLLEGKLLERRRACAIALAVSLAMLGAWLVAAWSLGVLEGQSAWTARMAGQTTRSARGAGYALDAILTKLPSGFGIQSLPLLFLGAVGATALPRRTVLLLGAWIVLVSAPLLLTLPDNRYFLPAYPAIAIVGAIGLQRLGTDRIRALVLSWLLCATILGFYAIVDLRERAFLFRRLLAPP